jgi:hypothetical protein
MSALLIFGDSWPSGQELVPGEQPYGELLYSRIGCDCVKTFSVPATSIPHLVLQLNSALEQDVAGSKAVFFLTGVDRELIWVDNRPTELCPSAPTDVQWYANYNSPELTQYRINTTLIALQAMCKKYNIEDYYIWGWDTVELWPSVDTSKFYHTTIADEFISDTTLPEDIRHLWPKDTNKITNKLTYISNTKNPYIWPKMCHPNQLGHQLIADVLATWICT